MKKHLLLLLLSGLCPALLSADDGCAKNADACSGGAQKTSPFVQASLREAPPADPAGKPAASLRQAPPAKPRAELKQAPVPPAVSTAPAVGAAAAPVRGGLSSPLWLVFVAGALAGLYFYLRSGAKRGRRK